MATDSIFGVKNIDCSWDQLHVIRNISITLSEGEKVAIYGLNGAGKTTLMRGIVNDPSLERTVDSITISGSECKNLRTEQFVKEGVTIVPQHGGLFRGMTVYENLELSFDNIAGGKSGKLRNSLVDIQEVFPRISNILDRKVESCSGGEQKMAMIAKGLVTEPDVLLLDEPTASLSPDLRKMVLESLATLDMTILITLPLTVENDEILNVDRKFTMQNGLLQ